MQRKKEKGLKSCLRDNRRYIVFEGKKEEAEKAILDYIGILGYAKASPYFVKSNILAVNREELESVKASFELAKIKIKNISGTLKKLKNNL